MYVSHGLVVDLRKKVRSCSKDKIGLCIFCCLRHSTGSMTNSLIAMSTHLPCTCHSPTIDADFCGQVNVKRC